MDSIRGREREREEDTRAHEAHTAAVTNELSRANVVQGCVDGVDGHKDARTQETRTHKRREISRRERDGWSSLDLTYHRHGHYEVEGQR